MKTPPLRGEQLAGVTRAALLDAAAWIGMPIDEEDVPTWAPFEALYLSSTLKELAPVESIGEEQLRVDHPLGVELLAAFRELVARETA
jgi:branched-subunit amino acid aminotransferase/4-amino-4-deoxychorismate lyase